ncbi:MAG: xanthine dehydrogenase accessory protein XdhC [Betaproteobacteria bacterium]|nr:xanthine dehydrogenase accessory protein XdhC [Betaproteobacteria bacterium]
MGAALDRASRAVLVCVAGARGSTPREAGAAMVVTATVAVGTIGGGKLEFEALRIARAALAADAADTGASSLVRFPLAASVGQCCGGVATLAFATFAAADRDWLAEVDGAARAGTALAVLIALAPGPGRRMRVSATAVHGSLGDAATDAAMIARARALLVDDRADTPRATIEQVAGGPVLVLLPRAAAFDVCLFGNGHVGRALAQVFGALPARLRWIDERDADFPQVVAPNIEIVVTDLPAAELRRAPAGAHVLVTTHSHALDFDLVAAALARDDWSYLGMIGSRAKRAQLARRLAERGLPPAALDRVVCPIGGGAGLPRGKSPGTIAVAVAAEILARRERAGAGAVTDAPPAAA